jgi:hypothetical protein
MMVVVADLAFHCCYGHRFYLNKNHKETALLMTTSKKAIIEAKKRKHKRKKPYNSILYTTGNIGLNIDRFNTAMGTNGLDAISPAVGEGTNCSSNCSEMGGLGEAMKLSEAKRYVRRYYIRPQNIFCSNKAEILKALIELDNANCSVYTLNNLGDDKDVSKLMNSDIIYYYDDGILYDKNKVKVMDYDLSIKKEEKRKHFANVDKAPDKEFKAEYSDRMTDATELEEAFNLDFEDFNVYGEKLTEAKENFCCICGEPIEGYGNNPEPFMSADEGRACDSCNLHFVIPMRLEQSKED